MIRNLRVLRKRVRRAEDQSPRPPASFRLIWYDPKSDPDNPDVTYDSETETFYDNDEAKPEVP